MPLPANGTPWPPEEQRPIVQGYKEHEAWWVGKADKLAEFYEGSNATRTIQRAGVIQRIVKYFWSRPTSETVSRQKLHIPIASDIAMTSAEQLYALPPKLTPETTHEQTAKQIERYLDDGLTNWLMEGAEYGSVFGGRYHVVTQIPGINDNRPFLQTMDPMDAVPEFRWGKLWAVTFATIVRRDGQRVWRHLERHELDTTGMGHVFHGLYEGTETHLGRMIPLTEDPQTALLAESINADGTMGTPSPGLGAVYVPNITPNKEHRKNPYGKGLGRSDFDGIEPLFDALDETWTSWMRDLRLGKSRILAANSMLTDNGPGQGAYFDLERELFTPLEGILPGRTDNALPIEKVQFDIRVAEHEQTANALQRMIIRQAGYSAASFGDDTGDTDITATEVRARQEKTLTTRDKKIRLETPALRQLLTKMLWLDRETNHATVDPEIALSIEFPDKVQESFSERAQGVSMLNAANAASIYTRVKLMNPDWDDHAIDEEVGRIQAETSMAEPDSFHPYHEQVEE